MLNIVKSELYKVIHRKCTYVFLIVFGLGGFFFNGLLKMAMISEAETAGDSLLNGWMEIIVVLGWFLVYMIAQTVHSNESKLGVLKNSISFGSNRTKFYIGRFLAQIICLVIAAVVVSFLVLAGTQIFFGGVTFAGIKEYYAYLGVMMIMWSAAISMAHSFEMNLNSNTLATVIFILYFSLSTDLIQLLDYLLPNSSIVDGIQKYEIRTIITETYMSDQLGTMWGKCILVAAVYLVVTFIIGLVVFRRKEVK